LLARVHACIQKNPPGERRAGARPNAYDAELVELRDALAEAKAEDIPPLVEQMARVAALAASRRRDEKLPVDPASPYFAHLRLREPLRAGGSGAGTVAAAGEPNQRVRDVLIGRRGYIDRAARGQSVGWRDGAV